MRKTYIFLAVLLLAGSAMLFGYWPGQAPSLFSDRRVKAPDGYELPHDVRQYRFVEIPPKMLDGVSDNLGFARIKLFGKEELTLEFEEREQDDGEAKITYGSVVGIPNSQVLMSRFGEAMSALVWLPDGRTHQIVYAGGNAHLLYEKDSRFQMKCEAVGIATNNAALPTAIKDASGKEVPVAYQTVIACNLEGGSAAERMDARQPSRGQHQAGTAPSEAKGFGGSILSFMGDVQRWASKPRSTQHANRKKNMSRVVGKDKVGVNAIDILVLFTDRAMNAAGGDAGARAQAGLLASHMRDSIANSDVTNIRINYTSARYTVETAANNSMAAELAVLTATDTILALRDKVRADLVTLLVSNADPLVPGIAQVSGAYSVIKMSLAGTITSSHELGHNFGCLHGYNRVEIPADPTINPPSGAAAFSSTNIPFPYGWNFTNNAGKYHTIMSYGWTGGSTEVPYFSNPDVYYQGGQTGMLTNAHTMGYGANNAMQIRNQAPITAKYK